MELDKIVPEYHSKNPLVRKLFSDRLNSAIKLAGSEKDLKRIIDLGCGEGALLKALEKRFGSVDIFGIDIEPNILRLEESSNAEIKVADLRKTGYPDGFFDLAVCLDVLEHFEDLNAPIVEIKRILKPRGLLIVSMPTESNLYKFCRLILKGTTSAKEGPCSSPHFSEAKSIEGFLVSKNFQKEEEIVLPFGFFPLFNIVSFRNS